MFAGVSAAEPEAIDPYELIEAVEILSKLPKDFYENLVSDAAERELQWNLSFCLQSATKWVETLCPKLGFYILLTSKGGNIAFLPPSPPCNVVPMCELPIENNKHPNFEWRGQGRVTDSFVLQSYPIWVECSCLQLWLRQIPRQNKEKYFICWLIINKTQLNFH